MSRILIYLVFTLTLIPSKGHCQLITGYCSFYADKFHGRHTSSGDLYNKDALTAAHRTLPFNTILEVTNIRNNKKILVRVNDRGPVTKRRLLDVSKAAAIKLDMIDYGVEKVSIKILDSATTAFLLDTIRNWRYDPKSESNAGKSDLKSAAVALKNHHVYNKEQNICELTGYGVQAGYYQNINNCVADIDRYEKTYKTTGYFRVNKKSHTTYYHLIMGCFASKSDAEKLRQQIMKSIPGCFVVSWSKL